MPNLINPLGSRLGSKRLWRSTYPVVYNLSDQFTYFELTMNLRLLMGVMLFRIFKVQPNAFVDEHFNGFLQYVVVNIWGAHADRCSVYARVYDYKLVVLLMQQEVTDYVVRQFAKVMALNFSFGRVEEGGVYTKKTTKNIGLFLSGGVNGNPIVNRVNNFISKFVARFTYIITERIEIWHYSITVFTRPYLAWLANKYNFAKLSFVTIIEHGSITAGMMVKYMVLKLQQGFELKMAIRNVRNGISQAVSSNNRILGYKLCCSGRFTRKQIATYRWFRRGHLCLNQASGGVDYAQGRGYSQFGAFGIKLWFFYR